MSGLIFNVRQVMNMNMDKDIPLINQICFDAHYSKGHGCTTLPKVLVIFDGYLRKWGSHFDQAAEQRDYIIMLKAIDDLRRFAQLFYAEKLVSLCLDIENKLNDHIVNEFLIEELCRCIKETKTLVHLWMAEYALHSC